MEDFYQAMEDKYGLSRQTIKNDIALGKRIVNLRQVFYASEKYKYSNLQEVFESVYARYNELLKEGNLGKLEIYDVMGEEYGYTAIMVYNIIKSMKTGVDWEGKAKLKIPMSQTLNRDRAIFIDCLNWTGTKVEFLEYAKSKYNVSSPVIYQTLQLNCIADPNRFEMSRLY